MSTNQGRPDWNAQRYLKFEDERTRPARDLLARVPLSSPDKIIDLGCGPGNSTALLAERYPNSKLSAMDSSPNMLEQARKLLPQVDFALGDLRTYEMDQPADLLFSNAVFQWVGQEERIPLIRRLLKAQPSGGVFAIQVPDNMAEPSHTLMRETARADGPWKATLEVHKPTRDTFPSPQVLYDEFKPLCSVVDIWHIHYQHRLANHEAIVDWLRATGLRPFLEPLDEPTREAFLQSYLERIRENYPLSKDGSVLLKFPRLFMVLHRM